MEKITKKEEEIMSFFWENGPLFVKELVAFYPAPKPHFNTVSTMVRALESKGYLSHNQYGNTYQYFPVVTEEEFRNGNLKGVINKYFENSYLSAVSTLVREEKISIQELKELISKIEGNS